MNPDVAFVVTFAMLYLITYVVRTVRDVRADVRPRYEPGELAVTNVVYDDALCTVIADDAGYELVVIASSDVQISHRSSFSIRMLP